MSDYVLTLDAAQTSFATINLGEPSESSLVGYFDGGDLGHTGGNLYLNIDGEEYGSLFFHRDPETGRINITLGAFDVETQDWQERTTLDGPIKFKED